MQLFVESPAAGLKMCALLNLQIPQKRSENTCVSELAFRLGEISLFFVVVVLLGPSPFLCCHGNPLLLGDILSSLDEFQGTPPLSSLFS